jgi:PIN domain nuclease of toxin-antitoxin system
VRLLLDTHILLWAAGEPGHLTDAARALLEDDAHTVVFSAASLWELTIKRALGRDDLQVEPTVLRRGLVDNGYLELPITADHALRLAALPNHHRDPFDRILLAQALHEGCVLVTSDAQLAAYGGPVRQV